MSLRWSPSAYDDLRRVHEFREPVDPAAAVRDVQAVLARVRRIPAQPRLGERVLGFGEREVRRVLVSKYEIRYEVSGGDLYVLRIFHTREHR